MDISSLHNISSGVIREAAERNATAGEKKAGAGFEDFFGKAVESIKTTNTYLSDAENEKIRWALGETESTHELSIAMQKASTALQYTVAVRDKFLEAYREIMQMTV